MQVLQTVLTFAASPQKATFQNSAGTSIFKCTHIYAEPLHTNTHVSYVGTAAMMSGVTDVNVIKQLQSPSAGVNPLQNFWELADYRGNVVDIAQFSFDGTSGEKMKVTVFLE
jgi:hypothetical protein